MASLTCHTRSPNEVHPVLVRALADADIDEARLKIDYLFAELFQCRRLELPLHMDIPCLCEAHYIQLMRWTERLMRHEPLQYVLGYTEFRGWRLAVDSRALIPRPETELLVEYVLRAPVMKRPHLHGMDIGTGSGCIIISLALEGPVNAVWSAVDVKKEALALARSNAEYHGVSRRIIWQQQSLLDHQQPHSQDLIVANLPYISADEMKQLSRNVVDYEPASALYGGETGLELINLLVQQAEQVLTPSGMLFLEIGAAQGCAVTALFADNRWADVQIIKDYAGLDRFISAERTKY